MKIIRAVLVFGVLLTTGCELHQVKGEVAGVEVEAKAKAANGSGEFCPPGQARKGNC